MTVTIRDFLSQGTNVEQIINSLVENNMFHATIVSGEDGVGKKTLTRAICTSLLCSDPDPLKHPCGICDSCIQVQSENHPDMIVISPGKPLSPSVKPDRTTIPVDDIREMIRLCGSYSFEGGKRVVIIEKAESMTVQAANCLLKTLEEPPENTYFFLITSHPELLLTTIISRCRSLKLHPWEDTYLEMILRKEQVPEQRIHETVFFSHGSLGVAKKIATDEQYWETRNLILKNVYAADNRSDLIKFATTVKDKSPTLDEVLDMTESLLFLLLHAGRESRETPDGFPEAWGELSRSKDPEPFCRLFDTIRECRRMKQSSVGPLGIIENLLYSFMEEKEKWQK